MSTFNGGLPVGYQAPGLYPWQQPLYQQMQQMIQQQPAQPQQAQSMSRPTVHADIIQVADEQEAEKFNLNPGQRQMMMNADETEIYVKEAYQSGPPSLEVYIKRPPAPPKPEIDPALYVTWEGLEKRLESINGKKRNDKSEGSNE